MPPKEEAKAAEKKAKEEVKGTEKKAKEEAKPEDKGAFDQMVEEAKAKATAENAKRLEAGQGANLTEDQVKSITIEKRVRHFIRPDGGFRKGLSADEIDQACPLIQKTGREIMMDKKTGRLKASPGWDESIDTRRPVVGSGSKIKE